MFNSCCVVNCVSRRKDVNMFVFPKTEIGLLKWLVCIGCDNLRSLSYQELRKRFVCRKHFENRFLCMNRQRMRLRQGAYPTLFTENEMLTGVPECPISLTDTATENDDHDYCLKRKHVDHLYCKPAIVEKRLKIDETPISELSSLNDVNSNAGTSEVKRGQDAVESEIGTSEHKQGLDAVESVCRTPRKSGKIIYRKYQLSPKCKVLYNIFQKSKRQLNYLKRAKKAIKCSQSKSFETLTKQLNPITKKFLWMQIKQGSKAARGRRFSDDEKLIALSIMKQSPKCYKFLHKLFILPSKVTLIKYVSNMNIEAGINPQIFEAIKEEVSTWDENKKITSILFDEVALETYVDYEKHKDSITGFVELNVKKNEFADHALVVMLRGVVGKWNQPLAFYFCKGATSAVDLKIILKKVVVAVGKANLTPIALICDQGAAFQSAIKSLQQETQREQIKAGRNTDDVIEIEKHCLSIIYDPPHLIKGLRNNFLTKDIKYEGKLCKWSDIVDVYKTDCSHAQMRLLHKLNDQHVIPEKIKKMKVKNCTRVFSKTVAATLLYTAQFARYADGREVSSTLKNTGEVVSFFDDLFDSVNGVGYGKKSKGKPLRHAVTETSSHHEFWREAVIKLKNIKYVDMKTGKETSVPSLKNFVTTIKSIEMIWKFLTAKGIKLLRPRYLNSDPIENFFGQMRAYNFRNTNPDCHTFKGTFKSLLITRLIKFHSESYNCEEDSGKQLLKLKKTVNF